MKISISTKALANALAELTPLTTKKTALLVLSYVKFVTKGNKIRLQASDGEMTIRMYVDADNIDTDGQFLVHGADLAAYTSKLKSDVIELDVTDSTLTVKHHAGKATFAVLDATDFPEANIPDNTIDLTLPARFFEECINDGKAFVSVDNFKPFLKPIRAIVNGEKFTFCATDTRKLITDSYVLPTPQPEVAWFVEQSAFGPLVKALKGNDLAEVKVSDNIVIYRIGSTMIITPQTKGNFPQFARVIPQTHTIEAKVDKRALLDTLSRVALFSDNKALVKMKLSPMMVELSADNIGKQSEANEMVDGTSTGELSIGLHATYFGECLGAVRAKDVLLELNSASQPMVIKDTDRINRTILIMPMTITE